MTWEIALTLAVILLVLGLAIFTRIAIDAVMIGGVSILLLTGVLDGKEALAGLSNDGMVTVGVLFVVAAGVRETGAVEWIVSRLFGRPKSTTGALIQLMLPVAGMSAFLNNTPLVAMLIPAVGDWAKQIRVPASKLMIPLSYAAIMGGTCSLIGTSTNLVVNGLLIQEAELQLAEYGQTALPATGLGMFDITWVGLPCALLGIAFVIGMNRWLLPDRSPALSQLSDPRQYSVEMLVTSDSPLAGKSIEQAGLRHLPGVYLAEIDREGQILPAVSPGERLRANDRLVFVGVVESVVDLHKIRGLMPATDQVFKLTAPRSQRCLIEAVVSNTSPLVGKTVRDGRFRSVYNAVIIAVARNGQRLPGKIGDIELEAGDTLLLEAPPIFQDQQRNNRDFFLVSRIENSNPPRHDKALTSIGILTGMVVLVTLSDLFGNAVPFLRNFNMLKAGLLAAGLMIATRCIPISAARKSVEWQVLLAIAAAFGLGRALEVTGAAKLLAGGMIGFAGDNPYVALAVIYFATMVCTELITNAAAAALMFPFALATANDLEVSFIPFVMAITMAASACFSTPIGYQTNLMVMGPGGYRFSDYLRAGLPMNLLLGSMAVVIISTVWGF